MLHRGEMQFVVQCGSLFKMALLFLFCNIFYELWGVFLRLLCLSRCKKKRERLNVEKKKNCHRKNKRIDRSFMTKKKRKCVQKAIEIGNCWQFLCFFLSCGSNAAYGWQILYQRWSTPTPPGGEWREIFIFFSFLFDIFWASLLLQCVIIFLSMFDLKWPDQNSMSVSLVGFNFLPLVQLWVCSTERERKKWMKDRKKERKKERRRVTDLQEGMCLAPFDGFLSSSH